MRVFMGALNEGAVADRLVHSREEVEIQDMLRASARVRVSS